MAAKLKREAERRERWKKRAEFKAQAAELAAAAQPGSS